MSSDSPELLLVEKHRLGDRPEEIYEVPSQKAKALKTALEGDDSSFADQPECQSFLKKVRENEYWIGCTCREGERPFMEAPVPLITVQKREHYIPLRLPKRPSHAQGCPLEGDRGKSDPTRREGEKIKDQGVCFHRRPTQRTETREETPESREKVRLPAKRSTMERTLYTLLDEGNLAVSRGNQLGQGEAFHHVAEAASDVPMASKFRLKDYLWVSPWKTGEAAEYLRKDWEKWSTSARPHGVFVFQADTVEEKTIIYDSERYRDETKGGGGHEIKQKIEMRAPEMEGPHIFLMTFADSEENPKWFDPQKAFGVPVVGGNYYFPVESEEERDLARILLRRFRNANKDLSKGGEEGGESLETLAEDKAIRLRKPLFSEQTLLGDCRPNLEVLWRGSRVVLRFIERRDLYVGDEDAVEDVLDYQRLAKIGRPVLVETSGEESGWGIVEKTCTRIQNALTNAAKGEEEAPDLT